MTNEELIQKHMDAAFAGDLATMVDNFAPDGIILFGSEPIVGRAAIQQAFESMPMDPDSPDTEMDRVVSHGEYAFVTYRSAGRQGGDTFHIRDGKILMMSAHIAGLNG